MIIKVCGMRDADNIRAVVDAGADMIGLIFYPKSPRCVTMIDSRSGLIPDHASSDFAKVASNDKVSSIKERPQLVGVFVDDLPQNIVTRIYNYDLDYVQLHGDESPVMIENLKATVVPDIRKELKVIKAISIENKEDLQKCQQYEGLVDMFLFDTKCASVGGSGKKFDWQMLQAYNGNTPFLLSGGIAPDDVESIKEFHHPMFAGIDINSKFEIEPGFKDVEKVKTFISEMQ